MQKNKLIGILFDTGVLLILTLSLWVPQAQKVLGRVFAWDAFRHWDSAIMLPGWAYLRGEGINTDIISSWGLGAVVWISRGAQILGAFDHDHVLKVMMAMAIVYYGALFVFLKAWLRSFLLAAGLLAVAVKVQMFHSGISPLVWIYPQDTPLRHWLDLPVLWCLWQHARSDQNKYLTWAACCTGLSLAWQLSTGLCLLASLWGYVIFLLSMAGYRRKMVSSYEEIRRTIFYFVLPLSVMVFILFILLGKTVFVLEFWKNTFEPLQLFLRGVGTVSVLSCLYDRHFFAFVTGFVIPVIYAWTLLVMASAVYSKRSLREDLFMVPLCFYGLSMYVHYLAHGATSHYYALGVPLVMVIGFWISRAVQGNSQGRQLKITLLLTVGAWGALFSNILFIYYPNCFDISRMDWGVEANLYRSGFNFDQDAAMIGRLVPQDQKAALISGFEAELLIQAKRSPFFYYAPLVESTNLNTNSLLVTSLITQERLDKTIDQLVGQSPQYVFIDKRLLGQWPPELVQYYPGIVQVLRTISQRYVPLEEGQYVLAMKKK